MSRSVLLAGPCLLLGAGLLTACSPAPRAAGAPLRVVAAESPWGSVAAAVAGSAATVTSVIDNPALDPHEYTPTASVAAEVATADVVVDNGLGYDTFMSSLLSTGAAHQRTVVTASTVLGVSDPGTNPHLWYSIERVPRVAAAIEAALATADPSHAGAFRSNLARFDASLAPLDAALAEIKRARPGAPVAQTERVAGYLLAQAGLDVASPTAFSLAIESGQEPSAQATEEMTQLLDSKGVDVLVENTETVSPVTNQVVAEATAARIPVVGVSELVEPRGSSFAAWQSRQIVALAGALGVAVRL
jgi:zinc/manganese transport system substrate-binding protein